ncbi:MAG: methyltransferase domain-containing protein [Deltaproteobacteria bacterium]|nr:methyltransferase domain-containing protein [Deltaproteobacteria bacterium]
MPAFESPSARRPLRGKEDRLARIFDLEVHPLLVRRLEQMLITTVAEPLRTLGDEAQVLNIGSGAGAMAGEILENLSANARLITTYASSALLDMGKERLTETHPGRKVFHRQHDPNEKLPFAEHNFDLVLATLQTDELDSLDATLAELVRVLKPGGQLAVSVPLRGTWSAFLEIFREVLVTRWDVPALVALEQYEAHFPDGEALATGLERAGLQTVEIATEEWDLLFRGAREFFFAPIVETGPLRRWKEIAGTGDVLQGIFNDVRSAIDIYFSGRSFPVPIVAGCATGKAASSPGNP